VGSLALDLEAKGSEFGSSGPGKWLALNGNSNAHICFADKKHQLQATVAAWNGQSWDIVGKPGFSGFRIDSCSIAIDQSNGQAYVAVVKQSIGIEVWTFQDFDWKQIQGPTWQQLGNANRRQVTGMTVVDSVPYVLSSCGTDGYNPFCSGGTPYFPSSQETHSWMRWNWKNETWSQMGGVPFYTGLIGEMDVVASSKTTFVAFTKKGLGAPPKDYLALTVMYLNKDGYWQSLGPANFARGVNPSLAMNPVNGFPMVAFSDADKDMRLTVMAYNGEDWIALGGRGSASANPASYPMLSMTHSGKPAVVYGETDDSFGGKLVTWADNSWKPMGGAISSRSDVPMSLAFDSEGKPSLAYMSEHVTVAQFDAA